MKRFRTSGIGVRRERVRCGSGTPFTGVAGAESSHPGRDTVVSLVVSPGCQLCETAKDVVNGVARDHPVTVRIIDLGSPEGARLANLHRMPFPPLVLIDDQVHGYGRLSEKKLRRSLGAASRTRPGER